MYEKVDDFETALNLAKRLEYEVKNTLLGYLRCRINKNILKFKVLGQDSRQASLDLKINVTRHYYCYAPASEKHFAF